MLYLQADNCWRENKNHALLTYLGWLVERGIFKEIHLSYFCVGHTHFGPDQVASRISCCARCNDIFDRVENARILKNAYTPELDFELLDDVVNCQDTFFPHKSEKGERSYAKVRGSVIKRLVGITCVRHFKITMGAVKKPQKGEPTTRVVYRTKPAADSPWSAPANLFWHSPSGLADRKFGESLVKSPAETEKAANEAAKGLEAAKARIPEESYNRCLLDIEKLRNPVAVPFHWKDGGKFKCELEEQEREREQGQDEDELLVDQVVPDNPCARGYKSINGWATEQARQGTIAVGSMVMFTSYVTAKNPTKQRWQAEVPGGEAKGRNKALWWYAGKVKEWDKDEQCLTVHYYSQSLAQDVGQTYVRGRAQTRWSWLSLIDVFMTFPNLDGAGRMPRAVRRKVLSWITTAWCYSFRPYRGYCGHGGVRERGRGP